ncbi:MAG: type II and III secretion system protein family protein [Candidatus Binatia bacterium]
MKKMILWIAGVCVSMVMSATANAQPPGEVIQLEAGHHKVFPQSQPVQQVAIGDPEVADVRAVSKREVLVTGKKPGTTTLIVWQQGATRPQEFAVLVSPSTVAITDPHMLPFEGQVQADIKIVEVSRTALKQAGFNFLRNTGNSVVTVSPPGSLSSIEGSGGGFSLESASGFLPIPGAFNLLYANANDGLIAALSILENNGMAYVLAEPSLVAMSGQSASFLAGGEFPIPVVQNTGGGNGGSVTIEFKEFGVRLILAPTVLGPNRIVLKVAPEVSELDFTTAVRSAGVQVPGLTVRRSETTIELGDRESFVISGLVSRSVIANSDKVPWLGDIPVLGAFFRSNRINRLDKELIMVVTPHLVQPLAKGTLTPPAPGEAYRNYNPSSFDLLFFEKGDFQTRSPGFAR